MWTLISGHIISYLFEYSILKLFKNKFSNKTMSLAQIFFGWLFQEHVREDFNMTGGKRFMLKKDFRNRFITQSVKIIRNLIFFAHVITTLELGTWLIILAFLFYFIFLSFEPICKRKAKEYIFTEHFVFIVLFFIVTQGFKIYGLFDIFFITKPFIITAIILFLVFIILWFNYLFYLILIKISKTLSLIIQLCVNKIIFFLIFLLIVNFLFVSVISKENIKNENFFHELTLRVVCLNYFFINIFKKQIAF